MGTTQRMRNSTGWMKKPYLGLCRPYSRSTRLRSSLSAMAEASSSSSRDLSPFTSYLPPFQGFQKETDPVTPQTGSVTPPDSKGLQSRDGFPMYPVCLSLGKGEVKVPGRKDVLLFALPPFPS